MSKPVHYIALLLACCLAGCAVTATKNVPAIAPLRQADQALTVAQARLLVPDLQPLELSAEMRAAADRYVAGYGNPKQRLRALSELIRSPALLGVEYDGEYTGTAQEVYAARRANCVGFAHLFVAMARYVGLQAHYQQVQVKPNWQARGNLLLVNKHVNVTGRVTPDTIYNVDIDQDNYHRAENMYRISDAEALAQHYNNLAMQRLDQQDYVMAYAYVAKALELVPRAEYLWTNLGFIYRSNQQLEEAVAAYDVALALDRQAYSAMQNAMVLYTENGRQDLAQQYADELESYRRANPYYYARSSLLAAGEGDWDAAMAAIDKALRIKPDEFEFHLARLGFLLLQHNYQAAQTALEQAQSNALKQHQLKQLRRKLEEWDVDGRLQWQYNSAGG